MTPNHVPLQHIVRVRRTEDLMFVRTGVMDEVMVNANQVESSPDSTTTTLRRAGLPFSVDPMLVRFQFPGSLRNEKGETKRNYKRLGAAYAQGTGIPLGSGPLVDIVTSDASWGDIARNVIAYQWGRLAQKPAQLDLFSDEQPIELRPVRLVAPALVAVSPAEDRVNRLLAEASAEVTEGPLALPVIVPVKRLLDRRGLDQLLASVPSNGVQSYLVWTPNVPEATILADPQLLAQLLRLVTQLAERGLPVGHLHGGYVIGALHGFGISALIHNLGWVDKGEPAETTSGGLRSCRTYVPGLRHSVPFVTAFDLGRPLDADTYVQRYCECSFCAGSFESGQHPLDLLLEDELIIFKNGRNRRTPTSRATGVNTWHFLLSRHLEVERFSNQPAADVLKQDIERTAALAGRGETFGLRRLADRLAAA